MDKDVLLWLGGGVGTVIGVLLLIIYKGMAADMKVMRSEMEKQSVRVTAMEAKLEILWSMVGKRVGDLLVHEGK